MEIRFRLLGHPVHPVLIVFPLKLVYRLRVGVDDDAGLDAPNSMSGDATDIDRPA